MPALTILLLAWMLAMVAVPETPIARGLRKWLVETPARMLDRITRGHLLLAFVLAAFVAVTVWQFEADGVRLLSMMAPEITTWVAMFEVSTWLDVAVATITAVSALRLRTFGHAMRDRMPRRKPRGRRVRRSRPPANDDDRPGLAAAA